MRLLQISTPALLVLLVLSSVQGTQGRTIISAITPEQVRSIGESVQLNCTVKDADLFTVSWSKKSRTNPAEIFMFTMASSLTIKDPRFSIFYDANTTTYSLSISQIEQTDTGIYECMIIMSLSEKVTSTVELLVRHPPTISDKMTTPSATVAEHQPASLTCNAEGYPRPTITWRRAKHGIMPAGGHIATGNVLKIQSTRREDRGTYICMASNGVGKPVQKSISLEVEFPPKISVPRPKVAQALDYDISLECTVEAHPAPSVTWMRNNETLYNGDDFKISHLASADGVTSSALTIEAIESEMFGDYWCHASNKMGKAEARVNVFEVEIPDVNFKVVIWSGAAAGLGVSPVGVVLVAFLALINQHMK